MKDLMSSVFWKTFEDTPARVLSAEAVTTFGRVSCPGNEEPAFPASISADLACEL
jgi:hypothetical protein